MPTLRLLMGMMLIVVWLTAGCASHRDVQGTQQVGGAWPLDSLAYIYSDPVTASPVNDNPWRWLGFILNPVGVALDYTVNRPLYTLASGFPSLFGFTPEDATLHAQRPNRDYGNY
ncbi:MAG: hypothetical protein ACREJU_00265 [Nitrospiraceae bacterium]